jgi:nitrate/TMAO reductase-like tetraheme cytochrome c subunit
VNPISVAGFVCVLIGGAIVAAMAVTDIRVGHVNPYSAVVGYVVAPAILVLGLVLVPLGVLVRRRRLVVQARATGAPIPPLFPVYDLNRPAHRRTTAIVAAATLVVALVLGVAGLRGAEFGDSATFCGQTCHTVMQPQWDTYQASSHARVSCTQCHIGPGTSWFVRSKLSGTYQVFAYTLDIYPRPVPAPIESLRPSRDTCEACHWPERVYGDRLEVRTSFAADQANTRQDVPLTFRVGGGLAHSRGIHWHVANEVWYLPQDVERQQLAWVSVKGADGAFTEYVDPTLGRRPTQAEVDAGARLMDCIDCHNRSAHDVRPYVREVDRALAEGRLDVTLPFLKQQAVARGPQNLAQPYAEDANEVLARLRALDEFYRDGYPAVATQKQASIEQAERVLAEIYGRSVFHAMRTDWNTYADNIGHQDSPGCFRCHGWLVAADGPSAGQPISSGCTSCHTIPRSATADTGDAAGAAAAVARR